MTAELEFEMLERLVSEKEKRIRDDQSAFDDFLWTWPRNINFFVMDHDDEKADEIHIEMQSIKSVIKKVASQSKC